MISLWRYRLNARSEAASLVRRKGQSGDPADRAEVAQRLGRPTVQRPDGPLLWVHLGEGATIAAIALLLARLRDDMGRVGVVVTADDLTEPPALRDVFLQWLPADTDEAAKGFLDHWAPDTCLWVGAGWSPVLLGHMSERGIPSFCVDARLDDTEARSRRWKGALSRAELSRFRRILTGTAGDAARLIALGAPVDRVDSCGWLEASAGALPCDDGDWTAFCDVLQARPVWLAVDVPGAEYSAITEAHRIASRLSHRLLLILTPADPADGPALRDLLEGQGWQTALRSGGEDPREDTQIYVADLPGERGLWYRIAPVTFLGHTLTGGGPGPSPMEPAALGSVVVHGPQTGGHSAAYGRLRRAGAHCAVATGADLGRMIERVQAPDKAAELANAAWEVMTSGAEATDKVLSLLTDALSESPR